MQIARSVLPLAVLASLLWTAAPVHSFERGPNPAPKQAAPKPQPPPPPAVNKPDDRISKKEAKMKQRDKEIDKRMKQH
jgi:hypothetical protein